MKKLILASSIALMGSTAAHAVDIKAGDWTVSVGGIVNAYYTQVSCSGSQVGGIALADQGLGCGGNGTKTTIGNGLLPSGLIVSAKTTQNGYDIGSTIGIMTATSTNSGVGQNSVVDVRQGFFTLGNAAMGTFKLGRDYGIFGSNAILGDMTLLGAGSPNRATQQGRVTLGHIGAGYSYLGTYGQIGYSSPALGDGLKIDAALVSPVDASPFTSSNSPQLQVQLSGSGAGFKGWLGAKTQKFNGAAAVAPTFGTQFTLGTPGSAGVSDFTMSGAEAGASYSAGALGLLANVQGGKGLGILTDGDQGNTKSVNYFLQGTFKVTEQTKLGLNYGQSKNRDQTTGSGNLKSNQNVTAGVYHAITPSITLVGEIGQTKSRGFDGNESRLKGASLGGIYFF